MSVPVIDEMLQEGAAKALNDRSDGLSVQGQRIDDASDILDRDVVEKLDPAGLGVHRNMGGMCAIAVGALVAGIGRLRRRSGEGAERQ